LVIKRRDIAQILFLDILTVQLTVPGQQFQIRVVFLYDYFKTIILGKTTANANEKDKNKNFHNSNLIEV
jgi:hypothetical protein